MEERRRIGTIREAAILALFADGDFGNPGGTVIRIGDREGARPDLDCRVEPLPERTDRDYLRMDAATARRDRRAARRGRW
jgi:hypothetical protein